MKIRLRNLFVVLLLVIFSPVRLLQAASSPVQVTILHLNDFHGHLLPFMDKAVSATTPVGGAAYLAAAIEREKAKNPDGTLLLSAGDMFQGTPVSNVFHGEPVIRVMNQLGFDAMALGNHEFDWGLDVLERLRSMASFPFLSANITEQAGGELKGVAPYVLLTRKGLKIAVVGATTPGTPFATKPGNVAGLVFSEPQTSLPPIIEEARKRGAKLVVVLSHLGLDADEELARNVGGIDVIVGGHTHTVVTDPVKVGRTVITQAGSYGSYLGVLNLAVDPETGKATSSPSKNELQAIIAAPGAPMDEKTTRIVDEYNDQIKTEFGKAAGESSVDLERHAASESNLGDLIADSMREATGAEIAFQNGGGIRADVPKGKITLNQVYTLLPFDNDLVTMDLTGSQVLSLLEKSVATEERILQVSGLSVEYDMTKPPGHRVKAVLVSGRPLEPDRGYRVVTNDFLAAGGDRFQVFGEGKNPVYGDSLRDAFLIYLQKHSPVSPHIENRVVFTQESDRPGRK